MYKICIYSQCIHLHTFEVALFMEEEDYLVMMLCDVDEKKNVCAKLFVSADVNPWLCIVSTRYLYGTVSV